MSEPVHPESGPFRPVLALVRPWLPRVGLCLAALALLAWLAVPVAVRRVGESQGSAALGRALRIGGVRFNPFTLELRVDDIALAGARPGEPDAFSLAHADLDLEWRSLWRLAPVLGAVRLESPQLRIARTSPGRFDIDDILTRLAQPRAGAQEGGQSGPARFALYNVEVVDGQIAFDDRVVHEKHRVDGLSLGVPFVSGLAGDADVKVQPRLRLRLDGVAYDSQAEATPFGTDRDGRVQLHTGEVALGPWLAYWPAALGWRPTQGRLRLDATLAFEAPARGAPRLSIRGDAALDDLALVDAAARPLVAWRSLALHVDDLRPLERRVRLGKVALDGLDLPLSRDARGRLPFLEAFAGPAAASSPGAASAPATAPSAPSSPWQASVAEFALADARVGWRDAAVSPAVAYALDGVQLTLTDLRWPLPPGPAAAPASASASTQAQAQSVGVHAHARWTSAQGASAPSADEAGRLAVDGRLGARRSELAVDLDRIALAPLRPYAAAASLPAVTGTLQARVEARWDGPLADGLPALAVPRLAVDALELREPGRAEAALSWRHAALDGLALDLARRRATLAGIELVQPEAWLERDAAGTLNLARWMPARAAPAAPPAAASAPAGPGWQAKVGRIAVSAGRLHWRDAPAAGPVALDVDALQLAVGEFEWPAPAHAQTRVGLGARFTPGRRADAAAAGSLDFEGHAGLAPLSWEGELRLERLPLHLADAYLADASPLQLTHADAGWRGAVQGGIDDAGLRLHLRGDAVLTDLHARARRGAAPAAGADDLLAWQSLRAQGAELSLAPGRPPAVKVADIALADAYARLVVTEQGRFNLTDLAPPATGAPAPAAAPAADAAPSAPEASPRPDLRIGHLAWTNARIEYTDRFVRPNYSADLSGVEGSLGGFGLREPALAPLQIRGRVAGTGALDVQGLLNPLARPLALDVRARASDIELAPLSPYAGKYAGYAIERGKLTMDLHYKIDPDGRLAATNQVVLNQLTFGERVDSPSATRLPVLFAVALLKDRNGVIDVDLPIGGSINDPDFSLGGLLARLLANLLGKAISAPFSLLSGTGGKDLSQVPFVPGTARPAEGGEAALDKIAQALQDRPGLTLTITGLADDARERAALQSAGLEARLVAMRRSELLQAGDPDPPAQPVLEAPDKARLIKRLYDDTPLADKPRNAFGLAKDLSQAEMTERLQAGLPLPQDAARELAVRRAAYVRDALERRGLPNGRMFVASPRTPGPGPSAWVPHALLELSAR